MKRFADLYEALDSTTSTLAKVEAMVRYFRETPRQDAAWALWFLTGRRPKRLLGTRLLVEWTLELTGTPDWLFSESYAVVGDLAECIALLLDDGTRVEHPDDTALSAWMESRILPLRGLSPEEQRAQVTGWWRSLDRRELFVLNKLLTGEFRVGVSETLVLRALSEVAGLPPPVLAQRTMGDWTPSAELLERILAQEHATDDASRPYPFFLASPLDDGAGGPRGALGVAGGVEVGRHPRTAGPPRRPGLPLVAGRGADHRRVSRRSTRQERRSPTERCSTARCWPTARTGRCPSPCSRPASDGRR